MPNWIKGLQWLTDTPWLTAFVLVLALVLMVLAYRIVMHGMCNGSELRIGKWFTWKK